MDTAATAATPDSAIPQTQLLKALEGLVAEYDLGVLERDPSIDTEAIAAARELIGKAKGPATPQITPISRADLPRIGASLLDGEFAGIVRGEEGDHALVLLGEAPKVLNFQRANKWAEDQGASLPSRAEQSILFGNLRDRFQAEWYWSCEQYAGAESYAWGQSVLYGTQFHSHETNELRARAVRRLPLQ